MDPSGTCSRTKASPSSSSSLSSATGIAVVARTKRKVIRLVVISDTHGQHMSLQLPPGHILLHCGDFADRGSQEDAAHFVQWISSLPQYPEKFVIPGNHDRTVRNKNRRKQKRHDEEDNEVKSSAANEDGAMNNKKMNLVELFAQADPSVKLLLDETVTTNDGLVIHGSSWESCEADSYGKVTANTNVWMYHRPPKLDFRIASFHANMALPPKQSFWHGWNSSRTITHMVQKLQIPLALSGHCHYARGALQLLPKKPSSSNDRWSSSEPAAATPFSSSPPPPTFINASSCWESKFGNGVSPPVVIDFDLDTKQVLNVQIEPHPSE